MSDEAITVHLPEDMLERLQREANRQGIAAEDLARRVIENYFDEPTKEELLDGLKTAMEDAIAGRGKPARQVLEDIRREIEADADES